MILGAFVLFFTASGFSQALTFDIVNETGIDLYSVFLSPSEEEHWGEDLLPVEMFANGSTVSIEIGEDYGDSCEFDVMVNDGEGSSLTFVEADLCSLVSITLFADGSYEVASE